MSPPAPAIPDPYGDDYSTVDECAAVLPQACVDQSFSKTPDPAAAVGPAASGSNNKSLIMVNCDLYSQAADSVGAAEKSGLPDISPYACFYGVPKQQVLKVGWLDKLSPQG